MNRQKRGLWKAAAGAAAGLAVLFFVGQLMAEETAKKEVYTYVGAKKCKACHSTKKSGAQYKIWETTLHAQAFAKLQTPEADAIAKEKGLSTPAAESPECLACHTTAAGKSAEIRGKVTNAEGINCEACHGPASGYYKMSTMKKLAAGEVEPASVGLTLPDETTCKGCHNEESPTFKEFDFDTFFKKIAHPKPVPAATPAK